MFLRLALALAFAVALPSAASKLTTTTRAPAALAPFLHGRSLHDENHGLEAQEELKKALAADPQFPSALSYLGLELGGKEGLRLAEQAVQNGAALPAAERMLLQAHLERMQGKDKEARASLREAARLAPDEWRLQFYIGRLAELNRLSGLAILSLRRAVELEPKAAPAWNSLGYARLDQQDFAGAIAAFKTYEALLPDDPNPPDSLAEAYLRNGQLADAEQALERARAKASGLKSSRDQAAHFLSYEESSLAQVRFMRGDYDGGREAAARALQQAPAPADRQQIERLIAWSFLAQGRNAEALRTVQEAEARAKKAPQALLLLQITEARLRLEAGQAREALEVARRVRAENAKAELSGEARALIEQRAWLASALAAARLGDLDEAVRAKQQLARMQREAPEVKELLSATHLASGMVALARHDTDAGLAELSRCSLDDTYCLWQLSLAQRSNGNEAGAAATRAGLLKLNLMEQIHLDDEALYVFVRGRLAAADEKK